MVQVTEYIAVRSVEQAIQSLQDAAGGGRVLAGGTDVIVQVRENRRYVGVFVDVKGIPDLNVLEIAADGSLRVGAAVSCSTIYENRVVANAFPALIDSASLIGAIQIQHRASIGGNLMNASPAADSIPTLIALGAQCLIAGPKGTRVLNAEDVCVGPGHNALSDDEILVELRIPAQMGGAGFLRFIPRNEMDIAVVNAAASVVLSTDQRTIQSARIAVGAVAPTPILVEDAGAALAGRSPTAETFELAASSARLVARPITDMRGSAAQRKHLVGVLVRRALELAVERARKVS